MERTHQTQTLTDVYGQLLQQPGASPHDTYARISYSWADDIRAVFISIARQLEPGFRFTDANIDIYRNLLRYAFANPECEWRLDRGVGLMGNTGSGKTLAMRLLDVVIRGYGIKWLRNGKPMPFSFGMVSARRMVSEFAAGGYEAVERYVRWPLLCIDDLGSEPQEASHYGNRINLLEHVLEERYLDRKLTHFTSNLNLDQLEQLYGQRVASRLAGTCNLVTMVDMDWRRAEP